MSSFPEHLGRGTEKKSLPRSTFVINHRRLCICIVFAVEFRQKGRVPGQKQRHGMLALIVSREFAIALGERT
jgi:hypothetical protein